MTDYEDPRSELLDLSARLRHLSAEHARAGVEGGARRRLRAEMTELSDHLTRRLSTLVDAEACRQEWWEHARHGAPAPERPEAGEGVAAAATATPPPRPSGRRPWPR